MIYKIVVTYETETSTQRYNYIEWEKVLESQIRI